MKRQSLCVAGLAGITIAAIALSPAAVASGNTGQVTGRKDHPQIFTGTGAQTSGRAAGGVRYPRLSGTGIEGTLIGVSATATNGTRSLPEPPHSSLPGSAQQMAVENMGYLGTGTVATSGTAHVNARHVSAANYPEASPNCGKGVRPRKVVGHYKAKRHHKAGYRTDTLYCGNAKYGYRHLQPHISQYFGGWGSFNFSISAVLKRPADWVVQANGNFRESAPIYQCFYAGYYIIWTFYVVPTINSGSIVTAYGHKGKTVDQPCPS